MKFVRMYTDGSCLGNPGNGGWCAILRCGDHEKLLSGGFLRTTNNRMELLAAVRGLEALKEPCEVEIFTDSRYLRDAIEKKWLQRWKKNGWKTSGRKAVKNQDLWLLLDQLAARHTVRFQWIRGHSGHPENERCDEAARNAASGLGLQNDPGYARE